MNTPPELDKPPFWGSWPRLYLAVILALVVQILLLAVFTYSFR